MAKKDKKPMTETEIVGFLGRKIVRSLNDEDGGVSDIRKENLKYYLGEEYGTEREGYSKYVSREVLETIEWVLPSVLRVFLSDDKVATFDAVGPNDEDQAKQETDIVNHAIRKANNSQAFLSFHHWFKDALMNPNGYIKAYRDEREVVDIVTLTGLTELAVSMVMEEDEVTVLEQDEYQETILVESQTNPGMTEPMEVTLFNLKIRRVTQETCLRIDPVPPEECLIDSDCTSQDLDTADFICHRTRKSYTELVQQGFDPDELNEVGGGDNHNWNDERVNRLFYEEESPDAEGDDDKSMRQFWVHECYVYLDEDGDGLAEHRQITLIGDRVFEDEEINYQPFVSLSSVLIPHKHTGLSYIDIVKDLQLLQSTLVRQLLDNIYRTNRNRKFLSVDSMTEDGSTMEALLNAQSEVVPVRGLAAQAVMPDTSPTIVAEILPVIQYLQTKQNNRTGVSPETAVEGGALQEVRQDVFANALDRASQRVEMLVRIFAETGFRTLMLKIHKIMRTHQDIETAFKLRGEWVQANPNEWRNRNDLTVNVGLGFNTKQMQMSLLEKLLMIQKEAAGENMATPSHVYNTLEKLIAAANLGNVESYFVDPESPDYQEPQPAPDPNMILAEAQAKALERGENYKENKLQADSQVGMAEIQSKERMQMAEIALKRDQERTKSIEAMASINLKDAQSDKAIADALAALLKAGSNPASPETAENAEAVENFDDGASS